MYSYEEVEDLLLVKLFESWPRESNKYFSFVEKDIKTFQDILNFGEFYYLEDKGHYKVDIYSYYEVFNQEITYKEFYNRVQDLHSKSYVRIEGEKYQSSFTLISDILSETNKITGVGGLNIYISNILSGVMKKHLK